MVVGRFAQCSAPTTIILSRRKTVNRHCSNAHPILGFADSKNIWLPLSQTKIDWEREQEEDTGIARENYNNESPLQALSSLSVATTSFSRHVYSLFALASNDADNNNKRQQWLYPCHRKVRLPSTCAWNPSYIIWLWMTCVSYMWPRRCMLFSFIYNLFICIEISLSLSFRPSSSCIVCKIRSLFPRRNHCGPLYMHDV